jgi:hypothetical protein
MAGNPFLGDNTPIKYEPKTFVDRDGSVYTLDPSGRFWDKTGETIPNIDKYRPPVVQGVPSGLVEHVKTLDQHAPDTIKITSAIGVSLRNKSWNDQAFDRFVRATLDAMKIPGTPLPAAPRYKLADFPTVLMLINSGIDTTQFDPPEINYNQN